MSGCRILLLGGSGEAMELARELAGGPHTVVTSLAGRTRMPHRPPGDMRIGGFGGIEGLTNYLRSEAIDLLVDATHPYAAQMSFHGAAAAESVGIPHVQLRRPAWRPEGGDDWRRAADIHAAAAMMEPGSRVFLTTGRQEIKPFAGCRGVFFLVRVIDPPDEPLELSDCAVVTGRGPFERAGERDLMRQYGITLMVSKNSGGTATRAKIDAARELKIPVVMVDRPAVPTGPCVSDVAAATAWISAAWAAADGHDRDHKGGCR